MASSMLKLSADAAPEFAPIAHARDPVDALDFAPKFGPKFVPVSPRG